MCRPWPTRRALYPSRALTGDTPALPLSLSARFLRDQILNVTVNVLVFLSIACVTAQIEQQNNFMKAMDDKVSSKLIQHTRIHTTSCSLMPAHRDAKTLSLLMQSPYYYGGTNRANGPEMVQRCSALPSPLSKAHRTVSLVLSYCLRHDTDCRHGRQGELKTKHTESNPYN